MSASLVRARGSRAFDAGIFVTAGLAFLFCVPRASAQSPRALHLRQAADEIVSEALHREIYGKFDQRSRLLEEAIALSPDCRTARWQSGQVFYTRKWLSADAAAAAAQNDNRLARYAVRREKTPNTIEALLDLARWCRSEGLLDQERAHLTRVLEIDPDEPNARKALGFTRVAGEWISTEEQKRTEAFEKMRAEDLAAWKSAMEQYVKSLDSSRPSRRAYAENQIRQLQNPQAIAALEDILAPRSESAAGLAIEALSNMSDPEAALAMTRVAVETRWPSVRLAAATALKARPREQFVPALLGALVAPTRIRSELYRASGGRLVLRQMTERGRQDRVQQQMIVTEYRRQAAPGNDGTDSLGRALEDVQQRTETREAAARRQKEREERVNSRVMEVLRVSTGADVVANPDEWWSWWNRENEIYVEDTKPVQTALLTEQVVIRDRLGFAVPGQAGGSLGSLATAGTCECLAAGTLVWTETGPKAIERIRVGDRVLSQNVETGELAYKPVLKTTLRAAGPLVELDVHGEYVRTSGGHPFWVAGDGWTFARNLKAGAVLSALGEPVLLSSAKFEGQGETYNLVVADFNTYFVGRSRILSHDNTLRGATKAVVPGLAE